jgi:hypothetical protein
MSQPLARAEKRYAAAFLAVWLQFSALPALAAELGSGTLTLTATPAASGCPTEDELAAELSRRTKAPPGQVPIQLRVHIDALDGAYVAQIHVAGRKQGERTLRTEGPSCQGLRDALLVSLSLLLDEDPDTSSPAAPPADVPRSPDLPRSSDLPAPAADLPRVTPQLRDPSTASLWLELGAAGTHGLPYGVSAAFEAGVSFRSRRWEVGALGFWALPREVAFPPGSLEVGLWGVALSGCVVPVEVARAFRLSACGIAAASELAVQPRGFTRAWSRKRPLFLAGLGLEPRYAFTSRISVGVSLSVLAPLLREQFSVQGLGQGYATDRVVGKAGGELGFRFW